MLATVRDAAPTLLVPLAWAVVAGTHRGLVSGDAAFVMHLVMAAFLAAFAATGWSDMADGALRGWRTVLVVGLGVTVAGIAGFLVSSRALLAVSLVGWMLLPAAGLLYTGRLFAAARGFYYASGACSALGALAYLLALAGTAVPPLAGIALVAAGQTAGIVHAAVRSD